MTSTLLKTCYLFSSVADADIGNIADLAQSVTCIAGERVFSEGDTADALYLIRDGSIKLTHSGSDDDVQVATLGAGAHFGEMAFVDGAQRSARAEAVENSHLTKITYASLRALLDAKPAIGMAVHRSISKTLASRLRQTTSELIFSRELNQRRRG